MCKRFLIVCGGVTAADKYGYEVRLEVFKHLLHMSVISGGTILFRGGVGSAKALIGGVIFGDSLDVAIKGAFQAVLKFMKIVLFRCACGHTPEAVGLPAVEGAVL